MPLIELVNPECSDELWNEEGEDSEYCDRPTLILQALTKRWQYRTSTIFYLSFCCNFPYDLTDSIRDGRNWESRVVPIMVISRRPDRPELILDIYRPLLGSMYMRKLALLAENRTDELPRYFYYLTNGMGQFRISNLPSVHEGSLSRRNPSRRGSVSNQIDTDALVSINL